MRFRNYILALILILCSASMGYPQNDWKQVRSSAGKFYIINTTTGDTVKVQSLTGDFDLLNIGLKIRSTTAIDSFSVVGDTLKIWVGATQYNAFLPGAAPGGLSSESAWSIVLNNSGSSAIPTGVKISALTDRTAFGAGDKLMMEESTGELRKIDFSDLPGAGGGDAWSDPVDSDILPTGADNTYDLGSPGASFADIHWDGTATGNVTGALTGNASTATALAANGANAAAGNAILGVDASGAAEGAFDVIEPSEIDTYSELNTIVADETLSHSSLTESFTNKTIASFTNDVFADHVHEEIRNESGGALAVGDAVYISGFSVGQSLPLGTLADASSAATMPAVAILQDATLANNANGNFIEAGTVMNMNTSSWSVGDDLYISATGTSGNTLTNVKPTGTDLIQKIAEVLRSHATLGVIEVFGAGRTNDLPNIASANFWLGNGSGVPIAVTMSSEATMDNAGAVTLADGVTVTNWALGTPASGVATNFTGTAAGLTAGTATVATTVTITDNESTAETNAIIFTAGGALGGGNLGLESDGDLTYTPNTGNLSATQIGGITEANLVDKSATEVVTGSWDFGGATQFEIPNGAAPTAPNVAGEIVFDTNVMAATHGAIVGHDGTQVLNFVSTTDTPSDDEIPKFDSGTGKVTWEADVSAGSTVWSSIGDPTNNGLQTITFDNAELSLLTGDNDAAVSFFILQNTDADHTGGNMYLLDLDYSADDGDVDADFIRFQDSGGTVMTIQQDGDIATDGVIGAGGAITATGSFIIGSADMNETDLEKLDGITNGTAAANKAVVLDASLDIATINELTAGTLLSDSLNVDGNTLVVDAANNGVGIGIASPATAFHIFSSAAIPEPIVNLENTGGGALGYPVINFIRDDAAPGDGEVAGKIAFLGDDSGGTATSVVELYGYVEDITNTDEAGKYEIDVKMDGTFQGLLTLDGYNGSVNEGQIDLNIDQQDVDININWASGIALAVEGSSGNITASGNVLANANLSIGNTTTSAGVLTLLEDDDAGSNFASFQVPVLAANTVYTLPADDGDNLQFFQTDGNGTLDWATEADPNVDTHGEIIAIIDNTATDVGSGVWTFAGVTLAANENITLGSQTLDHDGTDFVFNDSVNLGGNALTTSVNIKSEPKHMVFTIIDPLATQTEDNEVCIWPVTPDSLTVDKIVVTLNASGNEVAGDLKYADTFIGLANAVVINVFDTSSGVLSDDTITSAGVPSGKAIYIAFDSAPNTAITQMSVDVTYHF